MIGVQVLLYCGSTGFGGYKQIVCKQGKEILGKFNQANPLSHYMIFRMNRLIFREQIISIDEPNFVEIRFMEQISPIDFEDHSILVPRSRNGKSLAVMN